MLTEPYVAQPIMLSISFAHIHAGKINHGIKVKIYSTIFLHSKERWITMASSKLQEIKLSHNKEQDTTTLNRRSNQQIEGSKVLQQT